MIKHKGGATSDVWCDRCEKQITNKFNDWRRNADDEDLCKNCYDKEE